MDRGTTATATLVARPARELEDHQLVDEVRRGDDVAFECLYDRYQPRIIAYIQGMVRDHARAEDIAQDVFMSALRRMRETERPIAFKPWIYEIARNACIDQFRRSKRAEELSYDAGQGLGGSDHVRLVTRDPSPDAAFDTKQRLDDLCGAFGGLSETHHQILVLREFEGLSYREIGERMSMSRPAVESTLFRARRRLTEEYDDLVSGRRCERVQATMAAAAEGMLGTRDRRRLARHISHCQPCRRHARMLGVDELASAQGLGAKLAALLPLPAFLVGRRPGHGGVAGSAGAQAAGAVAQWSAALSAAAEPLAAGWAKAAATVAAVAVVGVGAGVAGHGAALKLLSAGGHGPNGSTQTAVTRARERSARLPGGLDLGAALRGAAPIQGNGAATQIGRGGEQAGHRRHAPGAVARRRSGVVRGLGRSFGSSGSGLHVPVAPSTPSVQVPKVAPPVAHESASPVHAPADQPNVPVPSVDGPAAPGTPAPDSTAPSAPSGGSAQVGPPAAVRTVGG